MTEAKYLKAFQGLTTECKDSFVLNGDCLLVEEIKEEELKSKGGIIMASGNGRNVEGIEANKPVFVRVLATGEGYFDPETGEDTPLDVEVGDIVLIGKMGVNWFSTFGNIVTHGDVRIGLTRESEIRLRFKGQAGYDAVFKYLNREVYSNVS